MAQIPERRATLDNHERRVTLPEEGQDAERRVSTKSSPKAPAWDPAAVRRAPEARVHRGSKQPSTLGRGRGGAFARARRQRA